MKMIPSMPSNRGPIYRVGNGQTSEGSAITARELGTNPAALGNMTASQVRAIHQQTRAMEQQAEFAKLVISQLKKSNLSLSRRSNLAAAKQSSRAWVRKPPSMRW